MNISNNKSSLLCGLWSVGLLVSPSNKQSFTTILIQVFAACCLPVACWYIDMIVHDHDLPAAKEVITCRHAGDDHNNMSCTPIISHRATNSQDSYYNVHNAGFVFFVLLPYFTLVSVGLSMCMCGGFGGSYIAMPRGLC